MIGPSRERDGGRTLVTGNRYPLVNLCFHGVGRPLRPLEPGEDRYWISETLFQHVLDEVGDRPNITLSFDDGNTSDLAIGLPALMERNLGAHFFLLAGRLGTRGSLGEEDVRQLANAGMTIGSHGMSHRPWRALSDPELVEELDNARKRLADAANIAVNSVACPFGSYDRRVLQQIRRRGYTRVMTSDRAYTTKHSWVQPRFSLGSNDDLQSVRAILAGNSRRFRELEARSRLLLKRFR